ncbi:MAG: 3'-5' exoribonuclease [Candidatus Sericytochromatia bacterium]|nr:3'-5' exoribonuclease [Candidatus Sericytochromatia bacterium]
MNRYKNLEDITFVSFDLETTGLFPITCKIIEIGAIKFNLSGEIARFETLVNPNAPISIESYNVHQIDYDMIKDKPSIEEVLPDFINFIDDCVVIAHNSIFDVSFISYCLMKQNSPFPDNIVLDTRLLAKNLVKDSPNYKLKTLTEYFGFEGLTYHRAINDAEYCMKVFLEIIKLFNDNTIMLDEVMKYDTPIGFDIITKEHEKIDIPEYYLWVKDAIINNQKVKITYKKVDGEISEREITPINLLKLKNKIYLEAFCHLRGEKRNFKLSKILKIIYTI